MRILILDDSKSYGALLASACKKLGHASVSKQEPAEALAHLRENEVDIFLVDLDMPKMKGTVFATLVRQQGFDLPIGICRGNCQDDALTAKAESIGQVLPKIWTHADLRKMLRALQLERRQKSVSAPLPEAAQVTPNPAPDPVDDYGLDEQTFNDSDLPIAAQSMARGTGSTDKNLIIDDTVTEAEAMLPAPPLAPLRASKSPSASQIRKTAPRVHIRCSNWEQIRKLCTDAANGRTQITVRAQANLAKGQTVVLALALPDEMVVSIEATVIGARATNSSERRPYQINLVGLGPDQITYLIERCDENEMTAPADTAPVAARPRERPQVPLSPSTPSDAQPSIPDSIDSVDTMKGSPNYSPKISWD